MNSPIDPLQPVVDLSVRRRILDVDTRCVPARLRAAASLYGLDTAPLDAARVLVFGYGSAGLGLVHAINHPEAEVIVVEWRPGDAEGLLAIAAELGVKNIQLREAGPADINAGWGQFDYILIPGLYTLLPAQARAELFRLCRECLSPAGIACVGFATYPGSKAEDVVREYLGMRIHGVPPERAAAEARSMAAQMLDGLADSNPLAPAIREVLAGLPALDDAELVARYLGEDSGASYLVEFAGAALEHGLCYAGDAQPHTEVPTAHGNQVALALSLATLGQPKAVRQHHLDVLTGRKARLCLLVPAEQADRISATPELARLKYLFVAGHFLSAVNREADQYEETARRYLNHAGHTFETADEVMYAVVEVLSQSWPVPLDFATLCRLTAFPESPAMSEAAHEKAVLACLEELFRRDLVVFAREAPPAPRSAHVRVVPHVLLQGNAVAPDAQGDVYFFQPWDAVASISLPPGQRRTLAGLDGTRPVKTVLESALAGQEPASEKAGSRRQEVEARAIEMQLLRLGVLTGTREAWCAHYKDHLARVKSVSGSQWRGALFALVRHAIAAGPAAARRLSDKRSEPREADRKRLDELRRAEAYEEGVRLARRLTEKYPRSPFGWEELGKFLSHLGEKDEALVSCLSALLLEPLRPDVYTALAYVCRRLERFADVEFCYRTAILIAPELPHLWRQLGASMRDRAALQQSEAAFQRALALNPRSADLLGDMGAVLSEMGRYAESQSYFDQAVKLDPAHFSLSARLFVMARNEEVTAEQLFEAHRAYGRVIESQARDFMVTSHTNPKEPERRLRIGIVSGDLRNHAIASFIEPILEHIDHSAYEVHAYYTWANEDSGSQRLRSLVSVWNRVFHLSDDALTKKIRADGIDVLVDLSGHTGGQRLRVFARKPAPIQVSWMGYPGTTGLLAMDYHLLSRHTAKPGELDDQFTEKLVYLPVNTSFRPYADSPDVNELPALRNGHLTFGSFNRYNKIGENTVRLWCEVMQRVPDSRMVIGNVTERPLQKLLAGLFARHGVDPKRLTFKPRARMDAYLRFHHEVDMLLDTYPYTGGTTTHHALWMGVPVLTMRGRLRASRQTSGLLGCAGLFDWITDSREELLDKAEYWAGHLEELAAVRQGLRGQMQQSPLYDDRLASLGFQKAARMMWQRWCAGEPAASFSVDL